MSDFSSVNIGNYKYDEIAATYKIKENGSI